MSEALTLEKIEAMFTLAEIKVNAIYALHNRYMGKILNKADAEFSANYPWFLVSTQYGNVVLGPRKKVYHLEWVETKLRQKLPCEEGEEWISSQDNYVHSHTEEALLLNIKKLGKALHDLHFNFIQKE